MAPSISVLGRRIRTTRDYWNFITKVKHLEVQGLELSVQETLIAPEIIRASQEDESVLLYYRRHGRHYLCVVCKHENGAGFVITCYLADRIKEGKQIWLRSK